MRKLTALLFLLAPLCGFSQWNGTQTNDDVGIGIYTYPGTKLHVDGFTKMINHGTRNLMIETDDDDSWLTFHDPNNGWYSMGIDNSDGRKFKINFGGAVGDGNHFIMTPDGDVGIGTSSPTTKLQMKGGAFQQINSDNNSGIYLDAPATNEAKIGWRVSDNSERFRIHLKAINTSAERLAFYKTITGEAEVLSVLASGSVGIGTTTPGSFKLAVEGKIGAREVNVTATSPWPDYVFEKNYALPSLDSIKNYIDQNKHLPEVPSVKEVNANGVNLGEMNTLLLKKVEELTLYMIRQQKQIEEQRLEYTKQIESLSTQIKKLKERQ